MKLFRYCLLAILLFYPEFAGASEKLHAIAMHGKPLYPADYQYIGYANPDAPKRGEVKLSKTGSFDNINSLVVFGNSAEGLQYLNDRLMQRAWDEPFTLYGLVAKSIEVADDRSWIIFHLDEKAQFHDGKPMTTEDVKFSYEMYRKHGHPVRRRVYGLVKDVQIISDRDIKFTFGEGYDKESVLILAMMEVLPKHYWQNHDISKTTLEIPLCSGPYKIKELEPGRKISYQRVEDYWAKDHPVNKGRYNFDTIIYNYYRDDNISLQSFKAGDYDIRQEYDISKWNKSYDFKNLSEGKVVKEEIEHHRPEWLKAMIFNTRRELFADKKVRKALGLMFDFDWVNKNFFFGEFKRVESVFSNSELAATGSPTPEELKMLEPYKDVLPSEIFGDAWKAPTNDLRSNKREAVALLKDAGWVYKDQKLVNEKTGKRFSFEILVNDPNDEKVVLAFVRSLDQIGIEVNTRSVDSAQFVGRLESFDYDMVVYQWINSLSPGNEQVNYWGSAAADNNGSRNYAGVRNKAVDAIAASIAHSDDRPSLVASSKALDRVIMQGYYFVPLYYLGKDLVARDVNIKRPSITPTYGIVQETWWSEKKQ